jgi:hypothetical protein
MTRTVLYPGPRAGLRWREGRFWRIEARPDGSVTEHDHRGRSRTVAKPGEIARVVLVPAARTGRRATNLLPIGDVFALFGDADRLLRAVSVESIGLGYRREFAPEMLIRDRSGIADIALALGLALEPATDTEIAAVRGRRRHITDGPLSDRLRRLRALHVVLLPLLCAAWALSLAADQPGPTTPWKAATLLVATASALALSLTEATAAITFARRPPIPAPSNATVVPSVAALTDPTAKAWAKTGVLYISPDDVVLDEHGTEMWLPGPSRGGVVTCLITTDALHFVDRRSTRLLSLPVQMWTLGHDDHHALSAACEKAGIEVVTSNDYGDLPERVLALYIDESASPMLEQGIYAWTLPSISDHGSPLIVTPIFTGLIGMLIAAEGLLGVLPADDPAKSTALEVVALLGGLVTIGAFSVFVYVRHTMNRALGRGEGRLGEKT